MSRHGAEFVVHKPVRRCYGTPRSFTELEALVTELQGKPRQWAIYSLHGKMSAAHHRAHTLRKKRTPKALIQYGAHLQFTAAMVDGRGPCVLIRWIP